MSEVDALQTTLAAEHAAVYVFGVLGGRTSMSAEPGLAAAVAASYEDHRARRDELTDAIVETGAAAVAAEPAYDVPRRLSRPAQVARAALEVERGCATTYAWMVAETTAAWRRWAIRALNQTAVRELAYRGTPELFPGAGEHADR